MYARLFVRGRWHLRLNPCRPLRQRHKRKARALVKKEGRLFSGPKSGRNAPPGTTVQVQQKQKTVECAVILVTGTALLERNFPGPPILLFAS